MYLFLIDAGQHGASIADAVDQVASLRMVGKGNQMLDQPFLVIGQAELPVQFVDFMRHRIAARLQQRDCLSDPVLGHVIASI